MTLLSLAGALTAGAAPWYHQMLPDSVGIWTAEPVRLCDRTNLFDYMDGAGELYLAYNFRDLAIREYSSPGQPKITAEIYRMSSSQDAYGVLTYGRSVYCADALGKSWDRDYGAGLFTLWRGDYFIRVLAEKETRATRDFTIGLTKQLTAAIRAKSIRPSILDLLPGEGLVTRSDRFFRKHSVLNFHYYLADDNILGLSEKTDAVLADYKLGGHKARLLVVQYPTETDASAALESFNRAYFPDKPAADSSCRVEKVEREKFAGVTREGRVLRLVFEAATEQECLKLLRARP